VLNVSIRTLPSLRLKFKYLGSMTTFTFNGRFLWNYRFSSYRKR